MHRSAIAAFLLLLVACAAAKTVVYTGFLEGKNSVIIPYGFPTLGDGLVINTNSNFSHYLMTTLNPTVAYSTWNPLSSTWETSWTIQPCNLQQDFRNFNIQFGCHTIPAEEDRLTAGSNCPAEPVFYSIQVNEYNGTLPLWNPDAGMFRFNVSLGGAGTSLSSAAFNFTLEPDAKLMRYDSTLHITVITEDGSPSSAVIYLFDLHQDDKSGFANCMLDYGDADAQAAFSGGNGASLSYVGLDDDHIYQLVINGTEPRQNYLILAHVSGSSNRGWSRGAIWVVIAIAVGCFVVGAILAALISNFMWRHPSSEREPLVRG